MASLRISDGRNSFFQWDLNQKLIIDNPSVCNKVHFTNSSRDMALVAEVKTDENGVKYVDVPNSLLTMPLTLEVYLYQDNGDCKTTVSKYGFDVIKRNKPENYVYTEDEHKDFDQLLSEMEANVELTKQYRDEAMSTEIGTVREDLNELKGDLGNEIDLTWVDNAYVRGIEEIANQYYVCTDFIDVRNMSKIIVQTATDNDSSQIVFLKDDKEHIASFGMCLYAETPQEFNIDIPENTAYIRFSFKKSKGNYLTDAKARFTDLTPKIKENASNIIKTNDEINNLYNKINDLWNEIDLYGFDMGFIGDSITRGITYTDSTQYYQNSYNYPYLIGKRMNSDIINVSWGGLDAKGIWESESLNAKIQAITDRIVMVWLGTNNGMTDTVINDCVGDDLTTYANTIVGCYGKIIKTLQNNGCKVILSHIFTTNGNLSNTNATIDSLANHFGCKVITFSKSDITEMKKAIYHTAYNSHYNSVHFNDFGNNMLSKFFLRRMNEMYIAEPLYFEIKKEY